jgi:hypothetical protein
MREQVLGPPLCRIYERSGIAPLPPDAPPPPSLRTLRPPRSKSSRLVDARARPAKPVLRRYHQRAALSSAHIHAERAQYSLTRRVVLSARCVEGPSLGREQQGRANASWRDAAAAAVFPVRGIV